MQYIVNDDGSWLNVPYIPHYLKFVLLSYYCLEIEIRVTTLKNSPQPRLQSKCFEIHSIQVQVMMEIMHKKCFTNVEA